MARYRDPARFRSLEAANRAVAEERWTLRDLQNGYERIVRTRESLLKETAPLLANFAQMLQTMDGGEILVGEAGTPALLATVRTVLDRVRATVR